MPGLEQATIDSIFVLRASAYTDRQIARKLGINHKTVAKHRKAQGLGPNGWARRFLKLVGTDQAECSRCGQIKPLQGWPSQRRRIGPSYYYSYCSDCKTARYNRAVNRSEDANLRNRWSRLRARSARHGIVCTISLEEFLAQWRSQHGLCFYTDTELALDFGVGTSPGACSVDKVEPHLGYVTGNVVFACRRANTIKADVTLVEMQMWMPGWHERVARWRAGRTT